MPFCLFVAGHPQRLYWQTSSNRPGQANETWDSGHSQNPGLRLQCMCCALRCMESSMCAVRVPLGHISSLMHHHSSWHVLTLLVFEVTSWDATSGLPVPIDASAAAVKTVPWLWNGSHLKGHKGHKGHIAFKAWSAWSAVLGRWFFGESQRCKWRQDPGRALWVEASNLVPSNSTWLHSIYLKIYLNMILIDLVILHVISERKWLWWRRCMVSPLCSSHWHTFSLRLTNTRCSFALDIALKDCFKAGDAGKLKKNWSKSFLRFNPKLHTSNNFSLWPQTSNSTAAGARHGRSDYTAPFRPEQDTWQLGYLLAMNMKPVAWRNAQSEGLKCQILCAAAETNIKICQRQRCQSFCVDTCWL